MIEQEMILQACLHATRTSVWASPVETTSAAQIENAPILIKIKGRVWAPTSHKPKYVLLLKQEHYYVQCMHRRAHTRDPDQKAARAGMRESSWTDWQSEIASSQHLAVWISRDAYQVITRQEHYNRKMNIHPDGHSIYQKIVRPQRVRKTTREGPTGVSCLQGWLTHQQPSEMEIILDTTRIQGLSGPHHELLR